MNEPTKQAALDAFNKIRGSAFDLKELDDVPIWDKIGTEWYIWLRAWELATQAAYERIELVLDGKDFAITPTEVRIVEIQQALEWYADPIAYTLPVQDINHHVFPDRGDVARKALANESSGKGEKGCAATVT